MMRGRAVPTMGLVEGGEQEGEEQAADGQREPRARRSLFLFESYSWGVWTVKTGGGGIVLRHATSPCLQGVDVENCLGKSLRSFLREVVADATGDDAVLVFAHEFLRGRPGVWMRHAIGVTFQCDRRHTDNRCTASRASTSSYLCSPSARPRRY